MRWRRLVAALLVPLCTAGCYGGGAAPGGVGVDGGSGPITLAVGTVGQAYLQPILRQWNTDHPGQRVTLLSLPQTTDDQRAQMVNDLQLHSDRYDVLDLDVVWTAEFADAGWILPLNTGDFPLRQDLPSAVSTGEFHGHLYAVPYTSNAGLLYYRKDILAKAGAAPPTTWAQLRSDALHLAPGHPGMGGYAGQFQAYEGLTVNFAEAVQSAGGAILADNGTRVVVDSPQALSALDFLVSGFREGWIPRASLTYLEDQSKDAFESGHLLFLRNWPYAYGSFATPGPGNAVYGRFGAVPLPGADATHPGSSSLGGADLAISAYSRHPRTALAFIEYLTSEPVQRQVLTQGSFPPVWASLYDDPALIRQYPYLPALKTSILTALPRLQTPEYNQLSLIISTEVHNALTLRESPQAALAEMSADLQADLGPAQPNSS